MKRTRPYSPSTVEAARHLGRLVAVRRRDRGWTLADLAERVGVSLPTIRKVEEGDVTVGLGVALEAAAILGVPLFGDDSARRRSESAHLEERLALLPRTVQPRRAATNDF